MNDRDPRRIRQRHHTLKERVHDPYKLRRKLPEPALCPQCGAVYEQGRWTWRETSPAGAREELCQACHRVNDRYPAGELTLAGAFAGSHRDEIVRLARHVEERENAEHPLNRIMEIREQDGTTVITTTDIHLPRAIGHAIENAWQGELSTHYDEEGYFVRMRWRREA